MNHILLTSTVNINEHKNFMFQKDKETRIKTYFKSIQYWL